MSAGRPDPCPPPGPSPWQKAQLDHAKTAPENDGDSATTELLTGPEHNAMRLTGELAGAMRFIIGNAGSSDQYETVAHIHAIQQMILSQAAARAYPDRYRLLGESS